MTFNHHDSLMAEGDALLKALSHDGFPTSRIEISHTPSLDTVRITWSDETHEFSRMYDRRVQDAARAYLSPMRRFAEELNAHLFADENEAINAYQEPQLIRL